MNERNVEALVALMCEKRGLDVQGAQDIAEWLASRGVLVASALTEDALIGFCDVTGSFLTTDEMRTALERIAKGTAETE